MTDPLDRLFATIEARRAAGDAASSYTAKLLSEGVAKCAKKFGEEAVEAALAAVSGSQDELAAESADVLYHLAVLWAAAGITPENVYAKLARPREPIRAGGKSGPQALAFSASFIGQAFDQIQHALAHLGILDLHESQAELQPFAAGNKLHHRRRAFGFGQTGPFARVGPPAPS